MAHLCNAGAGLPALALRVAVVLQARKSWNTGFSSEPQEGFLFAQISAALFVLPSQLHISLQKAPS